MKLIINWLCRCPRSPRGLWGRQAMDLWTEHHTWQAGYKWKIKKYVLDLEKVNLVICCEKGYGGFVDGNDGNSTKQRSFCIPSYYCNKILCCIGGIYSFFYRMRLEIFILIWVNASSGIQKNRNAFKNIIYGKGGGDILYLHWMNNMIGDTGIFIDVKTIGQVKWRNSLFIVYEELASYRKVDIALFWLPGMGESCILYFCFPEETFKRSFNTFTANVDKLVPEYVKSWFCWITLYLT